ncbi:DoxX family protein [Luteimonas sp. SJ-92]|uniref:DoxX family protein n=1 Tax=Luteimonas salinisoli TaxID=2752307 RepID=A0A853JDV5_9GAMM|nr:DoxX family protein [Luteimonas salinisoli]NZA26718.1 DoxX family protein [Luteimonas salinisoli]
MAIARWHRWVEGWCAARPHAGLLLLRLVCGGHLVWMTQDNVFSWARMLEFRDFLAHHGFAWPLFCALLSVAGQFLGGLALVVGLYTRFAGLVVAVNFAVAIWMVDGRAPYPAAFAAMALVATGLCLMFTGAGRWSLDRVRRAA